MAPVGVSLSSLVLQWVYTEAQELDEANWSAILGPFGSNQLMSYPWAVSFFEKSCPAPFSPVSNWQLNSFLTRAVFRNSLKLLGASDLAGVTADLRFLVTAYNSQSNRDLPQN